MKETILKAIEDLYFNGPVEALPLGAFLDLYYYPDEEFPEVTLDKLFDETLKVCDKLMHHDKYFAFCWHLSKAILAYNMKHIHKGGDK